MRHDATHYVFLWELIFCLIHYIQLPENTYSFLVMITTFCREEMLGSYGIKYSICTEHCSKNCLESFILALSICVEVKVRMNVLSLHELFHYGNSTC